MDPVRNRKEREAFLQALMIWDRPESQLGGRPLSADTDTDAFIDKIFTAPSGGFLKD